MARLRSPWSCLLCAGSGNDPVLAHLPPASCRRQCIASTRTRRAATSAHPAAGPQPDRPNTPPDSLSERAPRREGARRADRARSHVWDETRTATFHLTVPSRPRRHGPPWRPGPPSCSHASSGDPSGVFSHASPPRPQVHTRPPPAAPAPGRPLLPCRHPAESRRRPPPIPNIPARPPSRLRRASRCRSPAPPLRPRVVATSAHHPALGRPPSAMHGGGPPPRLAARRRSARRMFCRIDSCTIGQTTSTL